MKKIERQVQILLDSMNEFKEIEKVVESLPRGYISVKNISGHTYYYRQWREGNKIISSYVNESSLNVIRQKIEIRKQNEELLRIINKDIKKAERAVLKAGLLSEEDLKKLHSGVPYSEIVK